VSKLFGYDFQVQYRQGRLNVVADALSRRDGDSPLLDSQITEPALAALSVPTFQLFADLRAELQASSDLRTRRDAVAAGEHDPTWSVRDGLILHNGRVFIPANAQVLDDVLQLAHTGAHEGIQKTLQRLRANFFIEHDRRVVRDFVQACATCQRNKTEALHLAGLLQPLPVPSRIWADISIDFIEALPKVHGKSVILTVVDRFSKYVRTSSRWGTRTPLRPSPAPSSTTLFGSTDFRSPSSATATRPSLVGCGGTFSVRRASSCVSARPSILKRMASLKR
jgi:hypothetical protein